jgi:hypothetical protein
MTFSNCTATVNSTIGDIGSFPENEVVMYSSTSRNAVQLTNVSALNPDGDSFTVDYLAPG